MDEWYSTLAVYIEQWMEWRVTWQCLLKGSLCISRTKMVYFESSIILEIPPWVNRARFLFCLRLFDIFDERYEM